MGLLHLQCASLRLFLYQPGVCLIQNSSPYFERLAKSRTVPCQTSWFLFLSAAHYGTDVAWLFLVCSRYFISRVPSLSGKHFFNYLNKLKTFVFKLVILRKRFNSLKFSKKLFFNILTVFLTMLLKSALMKSSEKDC